MAGRRVLDKMFGKYLFVTNFAGFGVLLGSGDIIEQTLVERWRTGKKDLTVDFNRSGRMLASTMAVVPWYHVWYKFLDKRLPGNTLRIVAKKSLLDLVIQAPVSFFIWIQALCLIEGRSVKESSNAYFVKLPPFMLAETVFWLPAQAVNFYFLPPRFRLMYIGGVSLVYSIFLSFLGNEYGEDKAQQEVVPSGSDTHIG